MAEYDSPWKEALDKFFAQALALLRPGVHREIDWTKDPESLETELRKSLPESEVGLKRLDKLVKVVRKKSGEPAYLHLEAQMFPEDDFERRMYVYHSKAEDRYDGPVVSYAILADEQADWLPKRYRFRLWGCRKTFSFRSAKLLKWRGKEEWLERHRNPFAVFLLAHLQALATRQDEEQRAVWKERLMANIVNRNLDREDQREWLRLIDWLMELPRERNRALWRRVWELAQQKEETMPFIDFMQEQELLAQQRGEQRGEQRGLLKGIRAMLRSRLPEREQAFMARAEKIEDLQLLERILEAATAGDVTQLDTLLPPP